MYDLFASYIYGVQCKASFVFTHANIHFAQTGRNKKTLINDCLKNNFANFIPEPLTKL